MKAALAWVMLLSSSQVFTEEWNNSIPESESSNPKIFTTWKEVNNKIKELFWVCEIDPYYRQAPWICQFFVNMKLAEIIDESFWYCMNILTQEVEKNMNGMNSDDSAFLDELERCINGKTNDILDWWIMFPTLIIPQEWTSL